MGSGAGTDGRWFDRYQIFVMERERTDLREEGSGCAEQQQPADAQRHRNARHDAACDDQMILTQQPIANSLAAL